MKIGIRYTFKFLICSSVNKNLLRHINIFNGKRIKRGFWKLYFSDKSYVFEMPIGIFGLLRLGHWHNRFSITATFGKVILIFLLWLTDLNYQNLISRYFKIILISLLDQVDLSQIYKNNYSIWKILRVNNIVLSRDEINNR